MIFESCSEIRGQLWEYLDGECEYETSRSVRYHLDHCAGCRRELDRSTAMQSDLRAMPRDRVPAELALRLRVALSHELHGNFFGRLWVRMENALRPLLLPASAGTAMAIICFGLIMGTHVVRVSPNAPDVPLEFATPPRVRALAPMDLTSDDQTVVVVTQVNAEGRVIGYRLVSGQQSPDLTKRLDRMMYFSLFQPATMFGRPTGGQVVLSLRQITVRG